MMPATPEIWVAVGGGLFAVGNVLVFWYREWRKHKTWSANGKALDEIKVSIEAIDVKVGKTTIKMTQIGTTVTEQKQQCERTVNRFDKTIGEQNQTLIDLAGKS